ncbi:MAG: protein kinase [Polyangiaceae bacterium]
MNERKNAEDVPVPRSPGLAPGSILEGRYRLNRKVGEGGHGVVFSGYHLTLDQPLAIKVVRLVDERGSLVGDRAARFLDEARTLSKLRHSNIVRVLDVGVHLGGEGGFTQAWLVMEWCGSRTLRDDLKARAGAPRSVEETWALLAPLVEAVAHAHKKGVIHRDIKPSNIMLVSEPGNTESARLIDFGIAKSLPLPQAGNRWTHSTGPKVFTPGYAAPEQVLGMKTGPWTDVHALALVLTEVLTGRSAYRDAEVTAVVDERRPTPARHGFDVGAWEPVLARALSIRSADRYVDAEEFYRALEASMGTTARQSSPPPSTRAASSAPPPQPACESEALRGLTIQTLRTGDAPDHPISGALPISETLPSRVETEHREPTPKTSADNGARAARWSPRWLAIGAAVAASTVLVGYVSTRRLSRPGAYADSIVIAPNAPLEQHLGVASNPVVPTADDEVTAESPRPSPVFDMFVSSSAGALVAAPANSAPAPTNSTKLAQPLPVPLRRVEPPPKSSANTTRADRCITEPLRCR